MGDGSERVEEEAGRTMLTLTCCASSKEELARSEEERENSNTFLMKSVFSLYC